MATNDPWSDFESVRHNIKHNTVDKLKHLMTGFNEECGAHLSKTGKKQELIDRILASLDSWRAAAKEDKWLKAKAVINQVKEHSRFTSSYNRNSSFSSTSGYEQSKPFYIGANSASTSTAINDPYAPPRKANTASMASMSSGSKLPAIRFKESCFWTLDQPVSGLIECPETLNHQDRKQQHLTFTLTPDQLAKMRTPGKNYQLRLFCTSSAFYASAYTYRANPIACPVEFPPTCEVRINNSQISANLKGLKKKPGTAPPPDITSACKLNSPNRVEMVYVNSQQPVVAKYYMIIMLVEGKTIDNLVVALQANKYQSAHTTRQQMQKALGEDDDIVAGPQKMSLRCPLTYARLNTPCRSSKCVHAQCFDATSWFSMMEQTTTWLCPVCERILDYNDLIVDGYIDEILKDVPESVEDVMVEADGQWHTVDNKYGSADWRLKHGPPPAISAKPLNQTPPQSTGIQNGKGKAADIEVLVLSDDDDTEEEGRVKRELSPSYASSANHSFDGYLSRGSQSQPPPQTPPSSNVIDLTLDSDDEDEPPRRTAPLPPPPPPPVPAISSMTNGKRKVGDAELDKASSADQLWKKGRLDPSRILPPPRPSSGNGAGPALHLSLSNHTPTSPRSRFSSSSFHNNTLPPIQGHATAFGMRTTSTNGNLSLPPLPLASNGGYVTPRSTSQNSRWPG